MEGASHLLDVLVILAAAVGAAALSRFLRTSVVLGYLFAGTVIGPHALGLVAHNETFELLAELGVVFLLFTVGLELPLQRLRTLRNQMAVSGLSQILLTSALLALVLWLLGLGPSQSVIVAAAISLSSTALVLRLLSESREVSSRVGRASVAVLLTQDLAVAFILVLINLLGQSQSADWLELAWPTLQMLAAMAVFAVAGRYVLAWLYRYIAAIGSPEVFTTFTLMIVIGSALFSGYIGLGMGLGAFLAGMLLADTRYRHQVAADILPFRMLLLGLFFLSVGMALDPGHAAAQPWLTAGVTFGILLAKGVILLLVAASARLTLPEALRFSLLLSQAGEFSFVILAAGLAVGMVEPAVAQTCGIAVALSMCLTPLLAAAGRALQRFLEMRGIGSKRREEGLSEIQDHIVIAGFGRLGRSLARDLREQGVPFIAVDANSRRVEAAAKEGFPIVFGDATRPEMLEALQLHRARAISVCIDDPGATLNLVALIHYIFPGMLVIARAYDEAHAEELRLAGAGEVILELSPTSRQFASHISRILKD
jgi:CPA2 family monovalent cation:H+ antiporter-2